MSIIDQVEELERSATPKPWVAAHEPVSVGGGFNGHRDFVRAGQKDITGATAHTTEFTSEENKAILARSTSVFPTWVTGETYPYAPNTRLLALARNSLPEVTELARAAQAVIAMLERVSALEDTDYIGDEGRALSTALDALLRVWGENVEGAK